MLNNNVSSNVGVPLCQDPGLELLYHWCAVKAWQGQILGAAMLNISKSQMNPSQESIIYR